MRKNWLFIISATIFVCLQFDASAQSKNKEKYRNSAMDPIRKMSDGKVLGVADALYVEGSYFNALDYYQQLKQKDERNPYYTWMIAECFRATRDYVPAAHYYNEVKALSKKVFPKATYYAGMMLKQQGEYDAAIASFNEFLTDNKKATKSEGSLDPKELKILKKLAQVEIDGCVMAKNSIKTPEAVTVINAGPNVNSIYTELSPYPLGDSSLLFSTIEQNEIIETNRGSVKGHKEHFMIAHKQPGYVDSFQWALPFYDAHNADPSAHVGNGCFSPGGDRFFFTKCAEDPTDSNQIKCKIFMSKFENKRAWSIPRPLDELGEGSNMMPYYAKVGKKDILFFVSDRKLQSRGMNDIWYSIVDPRNGSLGRPKNCGKQINTQMDEISPYYDTREGKLYFATSGLKSMGGTDIYSAVGGPSRFTKVQNMGYPINTSADELYYIKDPVGKPDAYIVSNRIGSFALKNPTCCNDIWRIQQEPVLAVIGEVQSKRTKALVPQTVVKMVDQRGEMNTYNSEDGKFIFSMSRGHAYVITADKPGYTSSRASVSTMEIKRSDPNDTVYVTIYIDSIKQSFSVSNIYYDYDKSTLRPESVAALDSVLHFLNDNPSISVEIYSYTDAKGTEAYNLALSQRRAQSVLDYLEKNGVDRARLTAKGFGSKNAVAPNGVGKKDNPEGRQLNRRTEFRVISDVPTRRVMYNSALPGSMDQQERNLHIEVEQDEEPANGKRPAATDED